MAHAISPATAAGASGTVNEPSIDAETNTSTVEALKEVSEHVDHSFEMGGLAFHSHLESGSEFSELIDEHGYVRASMMQAVRVIGGTLIGIAVLVYVLTEVFSLEAIANISSDDPFGSLIGEIETTGAAALGLLVIGLLVLAANRVMGFFGGGGF